MVCVGKDVVLGTQTAQHVGAEEQTAKCQDHRDAQAGENGGRDRGFHAVVLTCAEQLRDCNRTAQIQTGCDRHKQHGDRIRYADRGERSTADALAGDHAVRNLIHLLKCYAAQQRQRKTPQDFTGLSLGQVGYHS